MKRIAFIVNPISGTANKESVLEYLKGTFTREAGYDALFYATKGPGDAFVASSRFREQNYDIVVAVGGDGTVNQVAKGLINSDVQLGVIPMGSGNGLARHLKIPLSHYGAVETILSGKVKKIDAGKINDEVFFCTAGLGFEAVIGNKFNAAGSRGLMTYMEQCAKEYVKYIRESYKITINNKVYETKAFLITFANCAQWGNNVYIAPDANISDGLIDMVIWKRAPLIFMPMLTAGLMLKTIQYSEFIESFRSKEIKIERNAIGLIQFDGESRVMGREIVVSVMEGALNVLVPQSNDLLAFTRYIVPQLKDMLPKIPEL